LPQFDVFNGDADGLCALHQLRLAAPAEAVLVTGPKRDIALVERVEAAAGDRVTVLDVSLDRNRGALERLLARGVSVQWFDHHYAGVIPSHPLLDAHIDTAPEICTSAIVDRYLGARFRAWAVAAAYGDGLVRTAEALAASIGLNAAERETLRSLGEDLNYNAYGDTEADLLVPPAALYRELAPHSSPLRFAAEAAVVAKLRAGRLADVKRALAVAPYRPGVYLLPDADWARRVSGTFANDLAARAPDRAHAVLVPCPNDGYGVSIRAPRAAPTGCAALAREFATGGGREAAAGIDYLPADALELFIARFQTAFPRG
jgi:hypothetical protein